MKRLLTLALLLLPLVIGGLAFGKITASAESSTPASPQETSLLTPAGHFGGLVDATAAANGYAYIGSGAQILVYDVSTPDAPVQVGASPILAGTVRDIEISGTYLYAALGDAGVQILDISDPQHITILGGYTTYGEVSAVRVVGNYAYTASIFDSFRIFDVSSPAHPTQCGQFDAIYIGEGVDVVGTYAYVAAGGDGLRILDVSDCHNIASLGTYPSTYARDVAVSGDYAYLADGYGSPNFVVVNVSNPDAPAKIGSLAAPGEGYAVALEGSMAYLATWDNGVRFIDISNPTAPAELGFYNTPGRAEFVSVLDGYLYVADTWGGTRFIDANTPSNPALVYAYASPGEMYDLAVSGTSVFGLDNSLGFYTIDATHPQSPTLEAYESSILGDMTMQYSMATSGALTLITHNGNLEVIDTSDPAHPAFLSTYTTPGTAHKAALRGTLAYVADGENGLLILDVSNPHAIQTVGHFDTLGETFDVATDGHYAYLADGDQGLRVVDVSTPGAPHEVGNFQPGGYARGIALAGHKVMLSLTYGGLYVVNVSNPATPTSTGFYNTMIAEDMAATDRVGFVLANQFAGRLQMLDLTQPLTPTVLAEYPLTNGGAGTNDALVIQDGWLYVAAGSDGMLTFPLPGAIRITEVRPGQTRAGWSQQIDIYGENFPDDASVKVGTYDLASVTVLDATHLQVVVPDNIPAGQYDVTVSGAGLLDGSAAAAFEVLPAETDTLFAYPDELWVGPKVPRQYENTQIGLVVRRVGGTSPIDNLSVDFYLGDPQAGGSAIGSGTVVSLPPSAYTSTTGVDWQPTVAGLQDLFAVVKVGGTEQFVISRTVNVLAAAQDVTPPAITAFTVDGQGDSDVSTQDVSIQIFAQDDAGGVGVAAIYLMEFDWNPPLGQWILAQSSGWMEYQEPLTFTWSLHWFPGTKNLIAWAADYEGNITPLGTVRWINFIPPAISINQGQVQMFAYNLSAGQSFGATSTPAFGDPDLYFGDTNTWIAHSTNPGTQMDTISLTATHDDLYTLAVYGWETSRYGLRISPSLLGPTGGGVEKPAGSQITPPTAPATTAPRTQGLPAYIRTYDIYLPTVLR